MPNTTVRFATSADFPILLEIDAASFPEGIAYDSEELSYYMNLAGAETIVLESDGRIAAFLIVEMGSKTRTATIITLDVLRDYRRLGYGSELMRKSEQLVGERHARWLALQVDVNNAGAIEFYEKHGFRQVRRLRHYYADGHDAFQMAKTLPQNDGR